MGKKKPGGQPKQSPKLVEVALAVIETPAGYALQRRGLDPKIGAAGLLGCLGGKKREGESFLDAALREVSEESDLVLDRDSHERLGKVEVVSDMGGRAVRVLAHAIRFRTDRTDIQAKDGQGIEYYSWDEISQCQDELTPSTHTIFMDLIEEAERI